MQMHLSPESLALLQEHAKRTPQELLEWNTYHQRMQQYLEGEAAATEESVRRLRLQIQEMQVQAQEQAELQARTSSMLAKHRERSAEAEVAKAASAAAWGHPAPPHQRPEYQSRPMQPQQARGAGPPEVRGAGGRYVWQTDDVQQADERRTWDLQRPSRPRGVLSMPRPSDLPADLPGYIALAIENIADWNSGWVQEKMDKWVREGAKMLHVFPNRNAEAATGWAYVQVPEGQVLEFIKAVQSEWRACDQWKRVHRCSIRFWNAEPPPPAGICRPQPGICRSHFHGPLREPGRGHAAFLKV